MGDFARYLGRLGSDLEGLANDIDGIIQRKKDEDKAEQTGGKKPESNFKSLMSTSNFVSNKDKGKTKEPDKDLDMINKALDKMFGG